MRKVFKGWGQIRTPFVVCLGLKDLRISHTEL